MTETQPTFHVDVKYMFTDCKRTFWGNFNVYSQVLMPGWRVDNTAKIIQSPGFSSLRSILQNTCVHVNNREESNTFLF